MNPLTLGFLVLAAILVGVAVPVLIQLRATLRSVQTTFDEVRPQLSATLAEVQSAAARVNRISADVESGTRQVASLVSSVADLGGRVSEFGGTFRRAASIGSVVGPAIAAVVRAFTNRGSDSEAAGQTVSTSSHNVGSRSGDEQEIRT